jgi:hypothetical protein
MNAPAPKMPDPASAPQASPDSPSKAPQKSPADLVSGINSDLNSLMQLLASAKGVVSDQEKQALGAIIQSYQQFVEGLSSPQGEQQAPAQAPAPQATVSPEAGANPNARPM